MFYRISSGLQVNPNINTWHCTLWLTCWSAVMYADCKPCAGTPPVMAWIAFWMFKFDTAVAVAEGVDTPRLEAVTVWTGVLDDWATAAARLPWFFSNVLVSMMITLGSFVFTCKDNYDFENKIFFFIKANQSTTITNNPVI